MTGNADIEKYFLGWYAGYGVVETPIGAYTSIADTIDIFAKWDTNRINEEYITKEVKIKYISSSKQLSNLNKDKESLTISYNEGAYEVYAFNPQSASHYSNNNRNIVIPKYYDDGIHGKKPVVQINTTVNKNDYIIAGDTLAGLGYNYNFILPDTIETICDDAFAYSGANVYISRSLKNVGNNAFNGAQCYFPEHEYNVEGLEFDFIGDSAFNGNIKSNIFYPNFGVVFGISNNCSYVGKNLSFDGYYNGRLFINMTEEEFAQICGEELQYYSPLFNNSTYAHYEVCVNDVQWGNRYTPGIAIISNKNLLDGVYEIYSIQTNQEVLRITDDFVQNFSTNIHSIGHLHGDLIVILDTTVNLTVGGITCDILINVNNGTIEYRSKYNTYTLHEIIDNYLSSEDKEKINTIYVKTDIDEQIPSGFEKQIESDKTGYDMYVRNAEQS